MLGITCPSLDCYTYSKCSFSNFIHDDEKIERTVVKRCKSCDLDHTQDEYLHAKYSLTNIENESCHHKEEIQGTRQKDACKSCLKSQCSFRKRNYCSDSDCDCTSNYVYNFSISNKSNDVNDEKSVYFVYHVSLAIYKFLLHFKFHFSICMTYVTIDRFVSRFIMMYLIQYQSHMLLVNKW